ncbi:hypothetical protein AA0242T_2305 [Acetobacter aceti NRIC 0242]|uniref:Uncharacterized protein n=1 Tax=Acetobacter aceti NBRC 14818 TaxID=887700 RepID=A0AB33IG19_ACEAC|nr:hypothetical protein [Acetobacter aceti]TCS33050.1 hypothetical protein EDC15_109122 [Acetobacter aceti NBRC 14818]BCK76484.1 hypothetical protein EMQ_2090 [Acetobacter aceti NBRC 14818]GAN56224.1 hypothetical protein Abac_003_123 [Acetobacter aceti NBRC 14818]GBO81603.1 hypothetical protein AA0242T_2305 [Acetobacter aceti NRIC 0242]
MKKSAVQKRGAMNDAMTMREHIGMIVDLVKMIQAHPLQDQSRHREATFWLLDEIEAGAEIMRLQVEGAFA